MPLRCLVQKEEECKGGKKAKDRITALLSCSATEEKLRPLVIGQADQTTSDASAPMRNLPSLPSISPIRKLG